MKDIALVMSQANCSRAVVRMQLTSRGQKFWDTHPAKQLLSEDVRKGKAKEMKPKELYSNNPIYQEFEQAVFRKHIYQEQRKQSEQAYWLVKKNLLELKKVVVEAHEIASEWELQNDIDEIENVYSKWTLKE